MDMADLEKHHIHSQNLRGQLQPGQLQKTQHKGMAAESTRQQIC